VIFPRWKQFPAHWSIIAVGLGAFVTLVVSRSQYVPIWDSWVYGQCIVDAAERPLALQKLGCAGHFSHGYVALQVLFQLAGMTGISGILLCNALVGTLGILSVYSIARSLYHHPDYRLECALISCTWAVHPMLLASAVFVNIDYAVGNFALVALALLLRRRFLSCAMAGLLLAFSKEVGIAVYAILLLGYALAAVAARHRGGRAAVIGFRVGLLWLALPLFTTPIYLFVRRTEGGRLWGGASLWTILDQLTTWQLLAPNTLAMAGAIFVLNFSWVTTVAIVWCMIKRVVSWGSVRTLPDITGSHPRYVVCVLWSTALVVFVLTRLQTYVIVRYFLVLFPFLLLSALCALFRLSFGRVLRRSLLVLMTCLLAASSVRTIDPVSKRLYGTFRFDEHELLAMTSLNHECCGYGLDQLVYNLEFVHFHEAIEALQIYAHPSMDLPLVVAESTDWYLMHRMDTRTYRRSLAGPGTRAVPHFEAMPLAFHPNAPREIWYLALPTVDNSGPLQLLGKRYRVVQKHKFGQSGYLVEGYRMQLRSASF
jgi:hypothetical protein